ncbi:hypothetical protein VNO77_42665 [Canavalia gladiata]|uniref:Uncharacterized protein n=1 Tax=Canavalia gladiata TaxID=3824 RepID=A0AAN9JTB0_CANGL
MMLAKAFSGYLDPMLLGRSNTSSALERDLVGIRVPIVKLIPHSSFSIFFCHYSYLHHNHGRILLHTFCSFLKQNSKTHQLSLCKRRLLICFVSLFGGTMHHKGTQGMR